MLYYKSILFMNVDAERGVILLLNKKKAIILDNMLGMS